MSEISPNNDTSGSKMQNFEERDNQQSQSDFETEFLELLNPNSSDGRSILVFIRSRLIQFNLQKAYSEMCILNEVYVRAVNKIKQGEIIKIPHAWIRATAYNYIRELSRDWHKVAHLEDPQHYHEYSSVLEDIEPYFLSFIRQEELKLQQTLIRKAFEQLSSSEQQLLHLKIIQGLSWKQIQDLDEYQNCSLVGLRKRKQRVLEKLHKIYHFLDDSSEICSAITPV
ncbi:MAG: sigma-70 family RNA polymerase sigma factor [Cyanobacteria bacterium J06592_8]